MPDPQLPAAKRRLRELLRDVEYGPKLARLKRSDEREILDLIYANRGREARQRLNELDAARRRHRTLGERARDYAKLPRRARKQEWRPVMDRIVDHEKEFWKLYRAAVLAS